VLANITMSGYWRTVVIEIMRLSCYTKLSTTTICKKNVMIVVVGYLFFPNNEEKRNYRWCYKQQTNENE
jgi:hypothetical protein